MQQFFLLFGVLRSVTTGWRGRSVAASVFQDQCLVVAAQDTAHVVLTAVPGALVHRLFLTPDRMLEVAVLRQDFDQVVLRERIQLLDTQDRDVFAAFGTAFFQQVVVDLAAAQDQAFDLGRVDCIDFRDHGLERTFCQVFQRRDGQLVAQQRLRCQDDQRLAQRADDLTTQQV